MGGAERRPPPTIPHQCGCPQGREDDGELLNKFYVNIAERGFYSTTEESEGYSASRSDGKDTKDSKFKKTEKAATVCNVTDEIIPIAATFSCSSSKSW